VNISSEIITGLVCQSVRSVAYNANAASIVDSLR